MRQNIVVRLLRRLHLRCVPPRVLGNDSVGWCAKYPWEQNWCWASQRATVELGARQRAQDELRRSVA